MTDIATATPAERLALYRSKHLIDLQVEMHPLFARIYRCAVDGLRVHSTRNARWYHDPAELKSLLDAEYGGPWGGPRDDRKQVAIERIVTLVDRRTGLEADYPVDDEDDEPEFDRESQPEFNGAFR